MGFQIYRVSNSSYQKNDFFIQEQQILEKIPGVRYVNAISEIEAGDPIILLSNSQTNPSEISEALLEKTQLIIHPNSGYDNFNVDFLEKYKIPVLIGNPIRSHAVAEYILSALLHIYAPMQDHQHWRDDRSWDRKLLRDQKVLLLGYGHIGKVVKRALDALCYKVQVYDPHMGDLAKKPLYSDKLTDEMIEKTNIVICAASLNITSKNMIDLNFLKKLDPQNVIINAARGELINDEDLINYLKKNSQSQLYLDVFSSEPFPPGYLNEYPNVKKTSHIAGVYEKLNRDIIQYEYHIAKDFIQKFNDGQAEQFNLDYSDFLLHNRIKDNYVI